MAMTREERATQFDLANKLGEQGYATYAKLFLLFELRLTSDPRYIGFMEPGKGRITLNRTLAEHDLLLVIRHEILHEYLTHELRLLEHLAEKFPDLDEASLKEILYRDKIFNYAGDYEISNRGYTEQDKDDIRHMKFNGRIVSGLVTEDKHPDWVDLSVEEMYDLLEQEMEQNEPEMPPMPDDVGETASSEDTEGEEENSENQSESEGDSDNALDDNADAEDDNTDTDGSDDSDSEASGEDGADEGDGESSTLPVDRGGNKSPFNSESPGENPPTNIRVIRGSMKNGKFYDINGVEITPGV